MATEANRRQFFTAGKPHRGAKVDHSRQCRAKTDLSAAPNYKIAGSPLGIRMPLQAVPDSTNVGYIARIRAIAYIFFGLLN
jgi:hypothetical protein